MKGEWKTCCLECDKLYDETELTCNMPFSGSGEELRCPKCGEFEQLEDRWIEKGDKK